MKRYLKILVLIIGLLLIFDCGKKIKLPTSLSEQQEKISDTTYVQISPAWTQANGVPFKNPMDVYIGYDTYVYIADTGNDRIVKMNRKGEFMAEYSIKHPINICQDPLLRLAAVTGNNSIYFKGIFDQKPFHEVYATMDTVVTVTIIRDSTVVIVGVDTISSSYQAIACTPIPADTYFYFTCEQTEHTYHGVYGEKHQRDRIIKFFPKMRDDTLLLIASDTVVEKGGTVNPTRICSYKSGDFFNIIFCQNWDRYFVQRIEGEYPYSLIYFPNSDIWSSYYFGLPMDVAVDEFRNIYVADEGKDKILKFDKNGDFILSFGEYGSGYKEFKDPSGIAYYDKTLYIADAGNNRILRFQLSTDIAK
jgi:hypothetical protein